MYYVFLIYIYIVYKITSVVSSVALVGDILGRFSSPLERFKNVLNPQTVFYTMMFIRYLYTNFLYMHVRFSYFIMFSTSRCSRLKTFIVYFIHLLSMLYTYSSHFFPFQVKVLLGTVTTSCSFILW